VDVVTFNTAGDNAVKTPEALVPQAPIFQKVVRGDPDAPIIACQETTPVLARKLLELSKNGNFQVVWPGKAATPALFDSSPFLQGNMILVPKRYEVVHETTADYSGRAGRFWNALKGVIRGKNRPNDLVNAAQRRGLIDLTLKDRQTGRTFSVIATHLSGALRNQEEPRLAAEVRHAMASGPVVVMGDFNTPSLDTNRNGDPNVKTFWRNLDRDAGLADMGPKGEAGITDWESGTNIDHVLATGFQAIDSHVLSGNQMTIPGRPDAKGVSDHYAKAVTLDYEAP